MKRPATAQLAVGLFLVSEGVFFGFLIAAYIYYYAFAATGNQASRNLDPARTLIFTTCLLASSGTLWLAERRLAARHTNGFRLWLGITIALGAAFLCGQGMEYAGLIARQVTPARGLFGATFFTLTGFHGFHVLCGLVALSVLLRFASRRSVGDDALSGVGAVALYWHFVDAVWIVIFSLVYLTVWL